MPVDKALYDDWDQRICMERDIANELQDIAAGNAYLGRETLNDAVALPPELETAMNAVSERLGARAQGAHERAAATRRAILCTRNLLRVLKQRAHRFG